MTLRGRTALDAGWTCLGLVLIVVLLVASRRLLQSGHYVGAVYAGLFGGLIGLPFMVFTPISGRAPPPPPPPPFPPEEGP